MYRCAATSVAGFVQQLAVAYVTKGYWFYVTGWIPRTKAPEEVDRKLIDRYGIDVSKWARRRRWKRGQAKVQYLRHGEFFVLLATHGQHPFFAAEGKQVKDIRKAPIYFMGYAIGARLARSGTTWHASVRIDRTAFRERKAYFQSIAVFHSVEDLAAALRRIEYEPYAPVRDQLRQILRAVNRRRKAAGLELVPVAAIARRRRPVRPFE